MNNTWESMISLEPDGNLIVSDNIPPVREVVVPDAQLGYGFDGRIPLQDAMARDPHPIPSTQRREGYYGDNHFDYWASGLRDYFQLLDWLNSRQLPFSKVLDIGCASGRFLRHLSAQEFYPHSLLAGCDINRAHIDWCTQHLSQDIRFIQNTSVPHLPFEDNTFDCVTGFSVFTHIECFDTTWIAEINRILRPGGIAWLTIHSTRTWDMLKPSDPLYPAIEALEAPESLPGKVPLGELRKIFRFSADKSYSSNVFYADDYIHSVWGRIMKVICFLDVIPPRQEIVVLQKLDPHE